MQTETINEALDKIRVTLESSKARPTTKPPLSAKQKAERKANWLATFLKLEANHPQLVDLQNKVYDFKADYSARPRRGCGRRLLIYGENGTGKSHTAKAIARWHWNVVCDLPRVSDPGDTPYSVDRGVVCQRQAHCEFRNWARLLKEIKSGEWNAVADLCQAELVILDDVGAEHDPNKFGVGELYEVLERREYDWTVITTNVAPGNWAERFERRVASRLLRNFTHIALDKVRDYNSR